MSHVGFCSSSTSREAFKKSKIKKKISWCVLYEKCKNSKLYYPNMCSEKCFFQEIFQFIKFNYWILVRRFKSIFFEFWFFLKPSLNQLNVSSQSFPEVFHSSLCCQFQHDHQHPVMNRVFSNISMFLQLSVGEKLRPDQIRFQGQNSCLNWQNRWKHKMSKYLKANSIHIFFIDTLKAWANQFIQMMIISCRRLLAAVIL